MIGTVWIGREVAGWDLLPVSERICEMGLIVRSMAVVLFVGFLSGQRPVDAALVKYDLETLSDKSLYVVCARVTGLESFEGRFGNQGPVILTDVSLDVQETWKSPDAGKIANKITVRLLGGQIGDEWQRCPESPRYTLGEEVLVFVRRFRGKLWTTGWLQGKYRLTRNFSDVRVVEGKNGLPLRSKRPLPDVEREVREFVRQSRKRSEATQR